MYFLAVNTTDSTLCAVLRMGDRVYSVTEETGGKGHSSRLMPAVASLFEKAGASPSDIGAVAAVVGPGSFTGIRIGVAAMTGMAYALGLKRVTVTSFELLAYDRDELTAAVDAGHGNLYTASVRKGCVCETAFVEADRAADILPSCTLTLAGNMEKVLDAVVSQKVARGEFTDVLEPYYMRKSQAERAKDEV